MKTTAPNLIADNGLKIVTLVGDFINGFSGRANGSAKALSNANNEVLHMNGKPYFPAGGRAAFLSLIEQGCFTLPAFTFKAL